MKAETTLSLRMTLSIMLSALALLMCDQPLLAQAGARPAVTHKTLDQPTEIQGYPCAKGDAWFFVDGRLNRCTVTREISFGEARIPAGTYIALDPNGTPDLIQLPHDAPILGLTCLGGSWLGASEGSVVAFYPNGKLKLCYLAGDQQVQGIPCAHGGFWTSLSGVDPGVLFDENGKLRACKLAKDYGARHKGERFVQER
ncbi:MAG: hypothetical protein WB424_01145 [Terracidiphilus sp.]